MTIEQILEILENYKLRIPPTVFYDLKADIVNFEEPTTKNNTVDFNKINELADFAIKATGQRDSYSQGMCNGIEYLRATLTDTKPKYIYSNDEYKEPTTKNDLVTLTFSKGTLKYSCKDYVVYKKEWLRSHYGAEIDIMFGDSQYKEPTTKNNLGVDCISRDAVKYYIQAHIHEIITESGIDKNAHTNRVLRALLNGVDTMPSVTPQEPRWIPVSERMPEEDTDVLVTLECGLIGIMQKKLADDDYGEPCYIWQDFEGEEHEVIAWMPLPAPYKADRSEEE